MSENRKVDTLRLSRHDGATDGEEHESDYQRDEQQQAEHDERDDAHQFLPGECVRCCHYNEFTRSCFLLIQVIPKYSAHIPNSFSQSTSEKEYQHLQ